MDLAQMTTEHQRLSILLSLVSAGGYEYNESILQGALADWGLPCGRAKVRTLISWLKDQELVTTREVSGYMVARITQAGIDVTTGASTVPGVKRQGPGRN